MSVPEIRAMIQRAIELEFKHKIFLEYLKEHPLNVHNHIKIPAADKPKKLVKFVITYVKHVPDMMASIRRKICSASIEEAIEPFLTLTEAFFLSPPKNPESEDELMSIASSSYLTHRLFEEVNDKVYSIAQFRILDKDLTEANLLIHSVLGEPYANQLDQMIEKIVEQMTGLDSDFQSEYTHNLLKKAHLSPLQTKAELDIFPDAGLSVSSASR